MRNIFSIIKDWKKSKKTNIIRQDIHMSDYQYDDYFTVGAPATVVDLRSKFKMCRDQGNSQACTGFAVAGLIESKLHKYYKNTTPFVSPIYNWYFAKVMHKYEDSNKGVWLRNSLKSLYKYGFVNDKNFPFGLSKKQFMKKPSPSLIQLGITSKLYLHRTSYYLLNYSYVRDSLNRGAPVIFGIRLNNSFYGNKDGTIKDKNTNAYAHAMLIVGYNDLKGHYIVRNSWGRQWGDHGYCYIPYTYMEKNGFDYWTIREQRPKTQHL